MIMCYACFVNYALFCESTNLFICIYNFILTEVLLVLLKYYQIIYSAKPNATSSTGPIICVMRPRFVSVLVDGVILEKEFNKNNS